MANNNNIDGVTSTANPQIVGSGYKLPDGFNNSREPGELARLFTLNSESIYTKYSNKTGQVNSLFKFGPRQPFVDINPTNYKSGIHGLGEAVRDVERITKFSLSSGGVMFAVKQAAMQAFNSFNETKIYNPLMPIQVVASNASFGIIPTPTRHIDLGNVGAAFGFGSGKNTIPSGTVGVVPNDALTGKGNPYKGLIRGSTAAAANVLLQQKYPQATQSPSGRTSFGNILANYFKDGFNKLFGGIIPVGQPKGTIYRGDEGAYGLMLGSKSKFSYYSEDGDVLEWGRDTYQRWEAGGAENVIKKGGETSISDSKKLMRIKKLGISQTGQYFGQPTGFSLKLNSKGYKTYGANVGVDRTRLDNGGNTSYENSDIISAYVEFSKPETKSDSKFTDKNSDSVKNIQDNLDGILKKLKSSGYEFSADDGGKNTSQQFSNSSFIGFDNIKHLTKNPFESKSPFNYNGGYMTKFKLSRRKQLLDDPEGKGFAGAFLSDKINLIDIAEKSTYKQYADDQIAFFFKDLANDRIIPFRATVMGITENLEAEWNDISYVGRADRLFSYKGFTRSLAFTFTVNVNSIKELLPTWKKINYFCGLVKPSNYTGGGNRELFSRFIIPPLVEFTIGDMYKNQPGVISNIGMVIPNDAIWETLGEGGENNFTDVEKNWNYGNGSIKLPGSKHNYAQYPKTVEFSVNIKLLEKERPIVGGVQFGDRTGDFSSQLIVNDSSFDDQPTYISTDELPARRVQISPDAAYRGIIPTP